MKFFRRERGGASRGHRLYELGGAEERGGFAAQAVRAQPQRALQRNQSQIGTHSRSHDGALQTQNRRRARN